MSITDELREWMDRTTIRFDSHGCLLGTAEELTAIADRIDAVHAGLERENAELRERMAVLDESADSMHDGWVRLPVDADGVPIRFGDKVTVSWSEKVYEVSGFSYTQQLAGGKRTVWVDVYSPEKMRNVPLCGASSCRHYHAPTVEDVLREFAYGLGVPVANSYVAAAAAKLRLAGDAE